MTQDDKRLKEIRREKWEICVDIKNKKKRLVELSNMEAMITGYHKIIRAKQKYKKGKGKKYEKH